MIKYQNVVFQASNTDSDAAPWVSGNEVPCALIMPGTFTATSISFLSSVDGVTYSPLYDVGGGSLYSVTVGTSRQVPLKAEVMRGVKNLKLRIGASEGAIRTIVLVRNEV